MGRLPAPVASQPPLPGASVAPPADTAVPRDLDEWWQDIRANPLHAAPLYISQRFLEYVQWVQPAGTPDPQAGWLQLPDAPGRGRTWEHATWVTASDLADGALRDAVQPDSHVVDDRSWSAKARVRAVAQAGGDFVALLGPTRRFERLVDRRSLLEALGAVTVEP